MSGIGKNDISLEKSDLRTDSSPKLSSKSFMFATEASGGELTIDLNNLVTPSEYAANGFVNPTIAEISQMNLTVFKKRLRLLSSLNGELIQFDTFKVIGPAKIQLTGDYEPEGLDAGEIIVGYVEQIQTLTLPDSRLKRQTYLMTDGQTVINLGLNYEVGQGLEEGHNIGAIRVTRAGKTIYRNTGNVAASPSADGGYHEASGSTIELNVPALAGEIIDVELGCVSPSGDAEFFGALENLSGAVLALSEDVANVAHGDSDVTRYLDANPSELDRRSFGDKLLKVLEVEILTDEGVPDEWALPSNLGSSNSNVHTFTGLELGREYELSGLVYCRVNNSSDFAYADFLNNGSIVGRSGHFYSTTSALVELLSFHNVCHTFTAQATTMTVSLTINDAALIYGNGTRQQTYLRLQKKPKKMKIKDLIL